MKFPYISLRPLLASASIAAMVVLPAVADPVDWMQFDHAFTMTFPGYTGSTTLENFPVLVKVSENNGSGFLYSRCKAPYGGDLRFSDAEGNLLPSEIEFWDPSGTSYVWVRVPSLNASTKITAYYGHANPPAVTASDVWANGYVAVWHLNADSTATTQSDSTANALTLTEFPDQTQAYVTPAVTGIVGSAAQFGVKNDLTGCYTYGGSDGDADGKLTGFSAFTFEFWSWQNDHDPGSAAKDFYYMHHCDYNNRDAQAYKFWEQSSVGRTYAKTYYDDGTQGEVYGNDTTILPVRNSWNFHAVAFDNASSSRRIFLNDVRLKSTTGGTGTLTNEVVNYVGSFWLGNHHPWDGHAFPGKLDEVRISNVARSDDWVKASYDTVKTDGFAAYAETALKNDWTKFTHRFTVTFDGYSGSTTLAGFPVLVKVSSTDIPGFRYDDCLKPNGGDLRFADEQGNVLPSEVEVWDTTGTSYVWVGVPSLNNTTKITGYYGWALALDVTASDVWTNGYVAVWHLNAAADATTQTDSTANALVLTQYYPDNVDGVDPGVPGISGTAALFDVDPSHKDSYHHTDTDGTLSGFDSFTVEAWSYQEDHEAGMYGRDSYYFRCYDTSSSINAYRWYEVGSVGKTAASFTLDGGSEQTPWIDNIDVNKVPWKQWNHQTMRVEGDTGTFTMFLNKKKLATRQSSSYIGSLPTLAASTSDFVLGNSGRWNGAAFPGKLDEVRISNVARSDDWVTATYDTIMSSSFATVSSARENRLGVVILMR